MKNLHFNLTALLGLFLVLSFSGEATAQGDQPRASLMAGTTQTLGTDTKVTITYSRPAVKGRKIWGDLVPYGMSPGNKYSDNKPFPWRAGANENTTLEVNHDVRIEGKELPAGKYSIHMIPVKKGDWTVIFNEVHDAWGSYKYDESKDALRIMVSPVKAEHAEYLTYGFENLDGYSANAYLHWEKMKIPFEIEVANKAN